MSTKNETEGPCMGKSTGYKYFVTLSDNPTSDLWLKVSTV